MSLGANRVLSTTTYQPFMTDLLLAVGLPAADLTTAPVQLFSLNQDNALIGMIGVEAYSSVGLLRSLVVSPKHRGLGFGEQLVHYAEHWAQEQELTTLYLLTTTAAPFFAHLGYQVIERQTAPEMIQSTGQFAGLCPSSATLMRKVL